jgi:hypothetical protein
MRREINVSRCDNMSSFILSNAPTWYSIITRETSVTASLLNQLDSNVKLKSSL